MEDNPLGREEYIQKVLTAYRQTPGTTGTIRRPDRLLAAQLYARGVPLHAVENALVLAASRRLFRPTPAPPLATIRSLAYFLPVIDEACGGRSRGEGAMLSSHAEGVERQGRRNRCR